MGHKQSVFNTEVSLVRRGFHCSSLAAFKRTVATIIVFFCMQETDVFWPGMGLSEYFYSWAVSMYSVGELISAPLSGVATKYIPYRYTILLSSISLAIGGLIYAVAVQGWMILIARLLFGLNVGSGIVLVTTYLGETAIKVTSAREAAGQIRKKDNGGATLKDKLFIWYTFSNYIGYLAGLGE